jgi:hypothetical protein
MSEYDSTPPPPTHTRVTDTPNMRSNRSIFTKPKSSSESTIPHTLYTTRQLSSAINTVQAFPKAIRKKKKRFRHNLHVWESARNASVLYRYRQENVHGVNAEGAVVEFPSTYGYLDTKYRKLRTGKCPWWSMMPVSLSVPNQRNLYIDVEGPRPVRVCVPILVIVFNSDTPPTFNLSYYILG